MPSKINVSHTLSSAFNYHPLFTSVGPTITGLISHYTIIDTCTCLREWTTPQTIAEILKCADFALLFVYEIPRYFDV